MPVKHHNGAKGLCAGGGRGKSCASRPKIVFWGRRNERIIFVTLFIKCKIQPTTYCTNCPVSAMRWILAFLCINTTNSEQISHQEWRTKRNKGNSSPNELTKWKNKMKPAQKRKKKKKKKKKIILPKKEKKKKKKFSFAIPAEEYSMLENRNPSIFQKWIVNEKSRVNFQNWKTFVPTYK